MKLHISHGANPDIWFVVEPLEGHTRGAITHDMAIQSLLDAGRTVYELDATPFLGRAVQSEVDPEFRELLERSSLGTPGARKLRARADPDLVAEIRRRAHELANKPADDEAAQLFGKWLMDELGADDAASKDDKRL